MRLLANSEALETMSNWNDGFSIRIILRVEGMQGGELGHEVTRSSILFIIYQDGSLGPQDGFRIALVLKGSKVNEAWERLKAVVERGAEEFVVIEP